MTVVEQIGDSGLWTLVRAGDAEAFGTLFDRHADTVLNYCAFRLGTYRDAEDLTSTVFLESWRSRDRLEVPGDSALPLLFGIAAHVCAHQRRRLGRAAAALRRLPPELALGPDVADLVAARVDAERDANRMRDALSVLSADHCEVIELCLIGGLDISATARALHLPEGTVKSRLSRARAHLRTLLTPTPTSPSLEQP